MKDELLDRRITRMTNAGKLAQDIDGLADLIYRADDITPSICPMEYDDDDNLVGCKHPDEDKGCIKCIKEWLEMEVVE